MDTPDVQRALDAVRERCERHPDREATACLCGAADDVGVARVDRNGLPSPLVLCRRCGLIRMDPQPTEESLAWFYAHHYRAIYGPHERDPERLFARMRWKGELVRSVLEGAGVAPEIGPVVDIGCGAGWALLPLRPFGCELIGYDFDESLLEIGRTRALDLRRGGVARALRDGVQAELLICAHVLEHTKDPVEYLRSLRPLVRQPGWLYLEVPHLRRVAETLDGDSLLYWQRAHLWDFQRQHVEVLCVRAGWEVLHSGEDRLSVHLVCRPGHADAKRPLPELGRRVMAMLEDCEAQRRSLRTRGLRLLRWAVRRLKGMVMLPGPGS